MAIAAAVVPVFRSRRHDPKTVSVLTAPGPNGHTHCAIFDEDGNGRTSRDDGHYHEIVLCDVISANGHGHDMSARRCAHPHEEGIP